MLYTKVELPIGGHNAAHQKHALNIITIEYAPGERTDKCTVVHVRGHYTRPRAATYSFAGAVVLGDGQYDIAVLENRQLADEDGMQLAGAILVALERFAEGFVTDEYKRLQEPPQVMRFEAEPLLDQSLVVRMHHQCPTPGIAGFCAGSQDAMMLMALPVGDWIVRCANLDTDDGCPVSNGTLYVNRTAAGGFYRIAT